MKDVIHNFKLCAYIKHPKYIDETAYVIKINKNQVNIYLAGCNNATQWLRAFDFKCVKYKDYKVKRGYVEAFNSFKSVLDKLICKKEYTKFNVYGYSYGGGLALLCHEYIYQHREDIRDNIKTITYEAPKIFKRLKKLDIFRNLINYRMKKSLLSSFYPFYKNPGKTIILKSIKGLKFGFRPHYPEMIIEALKGE